MGATYTRQSSSAIVDGGIIEAADINAEFNQILAAFAVTSGHTHDGTAAEGGPITKLLGTAITIGDGTAGTDIAVTFDGESADGVLTWMEDEDYFQFSDDLLLTTTEKLQFRDTAIYINSSADGQLDLVADTEIQIAATTIDINGAVDISGALTLAGTTLAETISDTVGAMVTSNTESGITVAYDDADNTLDFTVGTLNQDTTGNAATATILETARTIGGTSFNGSANIAVALSATATALATARTIHGVSFDGTANIDLSEVISDTVGAMVTSNTESGITVAYDDTDNTLDFTVGTLNQDTTGNAATATALETARTIGGTSFDGTANIAVGLADTATALATARTIHGVSFDGTANIDLSEVISDTVGAMVSSNTESGITVTYQDADNTIDFTVGTLNQDTTGTAATVTTAAQPNITSLGTLTTLTVDNVIINGTTIGHTSDTDAIAIGSDGDVTLTQDLELQHDGAVLSFGANDEVTLTHVHNDGLLLNTDMQLQFRDSAINIRSDADGDLDINADDEVEINSTLIDVNGNLDVSGTLAQAGVATFAVAANVAQVALSSSSNAIAWDASAAANAYHVTTENTTFSAPSNAVEGAFICVEINYNGSHTIAFNTVFEFAASTAPTTTDTDGKTDILVFRYNGAVWQEVGRTLNLSES